MAVLAACVLLPVACGMHENGPAEQLVSGVYNRENETSIFSKRNEQKLHFFAPISLPQKHRLNAN